MIGGWMAYESTDGSWYPVLVSEDFRSVFVPGRARVLGCVGDRGVKRVRFEVPRFCDGTDLAGMDAQVHFTGAGGTEDWNPAVGVVVGEDSISFEWRPTSTAFEAEGVVAASVRMVGGSRVFGSGEGRFRVVGTLRHEAQGSPLADDAGDLIVITVAEDEGGE